MKKIISFFLVLSMVIGAMGLLLQENASASENDISLMFTSDMHSHLESEKDGSSDKGGFGRIKTLKDKIEESYKSTFLVDSGDFSMGTPFQVLFSTEAPELKVMTEIGYDAVALGNHEFDYKAEGLADMLNVMAAYRGEKNLLPSVLMGNVNWDKTLSNGDTKEAGAKLRSAFTNYGVADYTIVEKDGKRLAVFAVMGDDAISNAPEAGIEFDNYIDRAKEIVKEIEQNEEADIIVALSHSGIDEEDINNSEDVKLAEEVDGIDVIVSGHSHTRLAEPKVVNDTIIVASGEYANSVGHVVLEKDGESYKVKDYELINLDKTIEKDPAIESMVKKFKNTVNTEFFSEYGYKYDTLLANNSYTFTEINEFGKEQKEDSLANLISDSYIYAVEKAEDGKGDKVDVAVVPAGTVRGSLSTGKITVADAFNISSLGIGPDKMAGYPVVSIYLTGKELKAMAEVDASISPDMYEARLYMSGLGYTINDKRLFLNRTTDVRLIDRNGNEIQELKSDKLYRVVGGLYSCQMLSIVKEQSKGLLSIEPKDKEGNIIENFEDHIVKSKEGKELKEWYAVATYIDSFSGNDIPEYYSKTQGRKIIDNSLNPVKLLKQPNGMGLLLIGLILGAITIIVVIVIVVKRRRSKRRGFAKSMFSGGAIHGGRMSKARRKPKMKKHKFHIKRSKNNRKRR